MLPSRREPTCTTRLVTGNWLRLHNRCAEKIPFSPWIKQDRRATLHRKAVPPQVPLDLGLARLPIPPFLSTLLTHYCRNGGGWMYNLGSLGPQNGKPGPMYAAEGRPCVYRLGDRAFVWQGRACASIHSSERTNERKPISRPSASASEPGLARATLARLAARADLCRKPAGTETLMKLTVIIPVHNGGAGFDRCLRGLMSSRTLPDEVIVVDDASTDASAEVAQRYGAEVVRLLPPPHGPAFARNRGGEIAHAEVLFFTDADVLLHPDALGLAVETLQRDTTIDACFGSYDDMPAAEGLVSQYKNLLHHYVHQHGAESAGTFWTACGAIRKTAFQEAGGFSEAHKKPSIEDIELGTRLRCQGKKIRLVKAMQATHLKRWTFRELLRSDIFRRAVPWSRVILAEPRASKDLNLNASARWSAAAVLAFILACIAGFFFPLFFIAAAAMAASLFLLNFDLYRFFKQKRGWFFVVRVIPLHWFYFFYSATTFATVVALAIPSRVLRRGTRASHRNPTRLKKPPETSRTG